MGSNENPVILIVDDNPQNLQVIANTLNKNGYNPAVFLNGKQALEFLESEKPSLILLDVMMPEMDGYELCRRIKSNDSVKNIPIIFLTAKAGAENIIEAFKGGAVDYVSKPFNTVELLARIKTHVTIQKIQEKLINKNAELQEALDEIKTLRGIFPICSNCKKIRNDKGYWDELELYLSNHTHVKLIHGLCPECLAREFPEEQKEIKEKEEK